MKEGGVRFFMGDLGGRVGEGASMGNDIFSMVLMFSPLRYKFCISFSFNNICSTFHQLLIST